MVCTVLYIHFGSISPVSLADVAVLARRQYLPYPPARGIPSGLVYERMHQCRRLSPPSWVVVVWGRSLGLVK